MAVIGVGMLGYAFMGKAHSNAFRKVEYMAWPLPLVPRLVAIAGRNQDAVAEGALGELRHFRGRYLQDWGDDPTLDTWRFDPDQAGSGALGDLGTHVIDLARYLVGEFSSVVGIVKTFVSGRRVDDAIEAAVE